VGYDNEMRSIVFVTLIFAVLLSMLIPPVCRISFCVERIVAVETTRRILTRTGEKPRLLMLVSKKRQRGQQSTPVVITDRPYLLMSYLARTSQTNKPERQPHFSVRMISAVTPYTSNNRLLTMRNIFCTCVPTRVPLAYQSQSIDVQGREKEGLFCPKSVRQMGKRRRKRHLFFTSSYDRNSVRQGSEINDTHVLHRRLVLSAAPRTERQKPERYVVPTTPDLGDGSKCARSEVHCTTHQLVR
jgi:hypothetical protein